MDQSSSCSIKLVSTRSYISPGAEAAARAPIKLPKNSSLIMAVWFFQVSVAHFKLLSESDHLCKSELALKWNEATQSNSNCYLNAQLNQLWVASRHWEILGCLARDRGAGWPQKAWPLASVFSYILVNKEKIVAYCEGFSTLTPPDW